jgi:hypothetical protein
VNIASREIHAAADGLLRVKAGFHDSSFLYLKVHGFPPGKEYGTPMPLGLSALSPGKIEFIRRWIDSGASKSGDNIDPSLLDDTTASNMSFTPLAPPAPGEGFQVSTGTFNVNPNFEREIFLYRKTPNTTGVFVNKLHFKLRPNSHHLVLYVFDPTTPKYMLPPYDVIRDLHNPDGTDNSNTENQMYYHLFLGGSMVQEGEYAFPDGVGLYLPAGGGIDFNTHFVNRTSDTILGEAYANIYTTDISNVKHVAIPLFLNNTNINLPAHKSTVVSAVFTNDSTNPLNVFMLTSHNHEHGVKFQIKIFGGPRNGELVYESTDWEHPLIKSFDPPIVIPKGQGLQSVVTYNNATNNTIGFGLKSTDEMNIIFGYAY